MAMVAQSVVFPPFSLDLANEQLWRGDTPIVLRRQTFAVLRYLLEHAGQVVTKQALLEALWPGIYVTDVAPMICINELRKTLGDNVKHPLFFLPWRVGRCPYTPGAEHSPGRVPRTPRSCLSVRT